MLEAQTRMLFLSLCSCRAKWLKFRDNSSMPLATLKVTLSDGVVSVTGGAFVLIKEREALSPHEGPTFSLSRLILGEVFREEHRDKTNLTKQIFEE